MLSKYKIWLCPLTGRANNAQVCVLACNKDRMRTQAPVQLKNIAFCIFKYLFIQPRFPKIGCLEFYAAVNNFCSGGTRCQCHRPTAHSTTHPTAPPQIIYNAISTRMNHRPANYCDAGNILPHDTFDAQYIQDRVYCDKACINMQFKFEMQRIQ